MKTQSNHLIIVVWSMVALYILVFGLVTSFRHYNFHTQAWDMGIFDQVFWNTAQGNIMSSSIEEIPNHLGIHFSPWLFALAPVYALFKSPYFLLIAQTIALAVGAIPLYLLARKILKSNTWASVVAFGYLLYPSLHWINIFDFHSVSFLVPLLLCAFYFFKIEKYALSALFFTLSASTREDAIIVVLFSGLYILLSGKLELEPDTYKRVRKFALLIIAASIVYLLVVIQIIMPALGGGLVRLDRYENLGGSISEILINAVTEPTLIVETIFTVPKALYVIWLFIPVLFVSFFSGRALVLLIPGLAENLLTAFSPQFSGLYQYDSVLVAAIFISTIYGIKHIIHRKASLQKSLMYGVFAAIIFGFLARSPISPLHFPFYIFKSGEREASMRKMVISVPKEAIVSAHTNLVPHLSNRTYIYTLGTEPTPADILLVDGGDPFGFDSVESFRSYISSYTESGNYNVEFIDDKRAVIKRKK
ncbi:MAG: hypothetical protein A2W41_03350 [Candidatus Ryanbacteria bacterium RIFCSPHIGHO2_01_45_13]|uniref:DUF2079 domain-containing protein n=1 Tax=Candidatus Ryanbacteria bacterium RIFCSPHIGHO2_01_45_13 TaxID=1802112 RepID=A0A1G2FXF2_9BACT|nr:MAG: hypothetical protein A2W41_03350 [Candidatus Ryanbacteria bacterium RIFCSPHIGHO2_01_45_13]